MATWVDKAEEVVMDKIAHMPKPSADLTAVHVKTFSRQAVTLKSDVSVTNPYDHDLPVIEITYLLRSNDKEIMSGTITDPGAVKANSATAMEVASEVAFNFLLDIMRDIGSDWDIDYDFDIGIKFHLPIVGSFTLPLHHKDTLKLPTLSDIL